jgi:hypothetical protein
MLGGCRIAKVGDVPGAGALLGIGLHAATIIWSMPKGTYLVLANVGSPMIRCTFEHVPAALSFRLLGACHASFVMRSTFQQFGTYPLEISNQGIRRFLALFIPMAFVGWMPAAVLLSQGHTRPIPVWVHGHPPDSELSCSSECSDSFCMSRDTTNHREHDSATIIMTMNGWCSERLHSFPKRGFADARVENQPSQVFGLFLFQNPSRSHHGEARWLTRITG